MRRLPTTVRGVPLVADEHLAEALVGIGFVLIVLFFLLRGSRIAWSFFALTEAFAVGVQPFDPFVWRRGA